MRRCRNRNKDCNIDIEYLKYIFEQQNGKCAVTGVPLVLESKVTNPNYSASVDRIDSSKGYVKDNIRFISLTTNYAKNSYDPKFMIEYIDIIRNIDEDALPHL